VGVKAVTIKKHGTPIGQGNGKRKAPNKMRSPRTKKGKPRFKVKSV